MEDSNVWNINIYIADCVLELRGTEASCVWSKDIFGYVNTISNQKNSFTLIHIRKFCE